MKKNIKSILSLFVCLGLISGFASCDTDVEPTSNPGSTTYWKSQVEAAKFLDAIYGTMTPGPQTHQDSYSDDMYVQFPWESRGAQFVTNSLTTEPQNTAPSDYNFVGIAQVNEFLANVDKCVMDEGLRARMKAEARFFRAINYLHKTVQIGDVPIITSVLNPNITEIARDPAEEVRQFIIDELTEVAGILPVSYNGSTYYEKGRATRYAALAYLSRAALLFGNYTLAESAAREVMGGPFSLFTVSSLTPEQLIEARELDLYVDYTAMGVDRDRFLRGIYSYEMLWQKDYANPDNPEYIFSRQYAENVNGQENFAMYTQLRPSQLGGWSSVVPTQNLVNAYWSITGEAPSLLSPAERGAAYTALEKEYLALSTEMTFREFCAAKVADGSIVNNAYMQEFRNRDARLYASILFPFKGWPETEFGTDFYYRWIKTPSSNESQTGYNLRKMAAHSRSSSGEGNSVADLPCFRFAEILLIFAEARTQNVGYDGEVQAALNQLRNRLGMPDVPSSFASKQAALDYIRVERRIELSGEGLRNKDITRYEESYWENIFNNVPIYQPDGDILLTMQWGSRMRLRPIEQAAIDLNPLIEQNPGY